MVNQGTNSVTYCYNTGDVEGVYTYVGGIAGLNNKAMSTIEYCYSTGNIKGRTNVGGIVGKNIGSVTNSYYLENRVTVTTGNKTELGEEKDETGIKNITNIEKWKSYFKNDKSPNINKGWPILMWQ